MMNTIKKMALRHAALGGSLLTIFLGLSPLSLSSALAGDQVESPAVSASGSLATPLAIPTSFVPTIPSVPIIKPLSKPPIIPIFPVIESGSASPLSVPSTPSSTPSPSTTGSVIVSAGPSPELAPIVQPVASPSGDETAANDNAKHKTRIEALRKVAQRVRDQADHNIAQLTRRLDEITGRIRTTEGQERAKQERRAEGASRGYEVRIHALQQRSAQTTPSPQLRTRIEKEIQQLQTSEERIRAQFRAREETLTQQTEQQIQRMEHKIQIKIAEIQEWKDKRLAEIQKRIDDQLS